MLLAEVLPVSWRQGRQRNLNRSMRSLEFRHDLRHVHARSLTTARLAARLTKGIRHQRQDVVSSPLHGQL